VREALVDTLTDERHSVIQAGGGKGRPWRAGRGARVDVVITDSHARHDGLGRYARAVRRSGRAWPCAW